MPSHMSDNSFSRTNQNVAKIYWITVGVILAFLTMVNIIDKINVRLRLKAAFKSHPTPVETRLGQLWATSTALIREISLPSVPSFSGRDSLLAMFTPPPLGRSVLILLYSTMIVIMLSLDVYTSGHSYYEKIGYRAAWVTVTQIPFVLLIGGRVSIFTLLTGVENINWLHRWVGRVILVSLLVHMSSFWREWDLSNFLKTELEIMPMVRYGFGGFGVLAWLTLTSLAPVRWFAYEFFYFNHLVSIAVFFWCLYMHVPRSAIYNIYLGIGFMAFDRTCRMVIFLHSNIHYTIYRTDGSSLWGATNWQYFFSVGHIAEAEIVDPDAELIKVVIKDFKMKWRAGQHLYLSIPSIRAFETHPFSIGNACTPESENCNRSPTRTHDVHLLIRSRGGFTKRLHDRVRESSAPPLLRAFIEGPYGSPPEWRSFETVVLIASSTGLSFTLPVLAEIAENPACVRRVHFHWVVRYGSGIQQLAERIARITGKAKAKGVDVLVNISVTAAPLNIHESSDAIAAEAGTEAEEAILKDTKLPYLLPSYPASSWGNNTPKYEAIPLDPLPKRWSDSSQSPNWRSRNGSTSCLVGSGGGSSSDAPCSFDFSAPNFVFTSGRPCVQTMILPAVELAEGETVVACCANRRLMDDVRNYVGQLCDERAVHKGSGAQGILCWTEGFY
ncbi:hypothetical protein H072_8799 [Dactylellina haptotyla CBS 200.50]|uniref:ferric-chelate reductase (NADPH) n=1 Tax=Dactylellina haptotyla (strain CBS 200.50) TaxID=1284197 RepID=S8BQK0_DACHA|nr:hypothetical protein H072_8799 [Dactylellina haptotyla CBS 200.50]